MSDPGQFQTTQAAARNATQDLIRRIGINLHHGNQPAIQKTEHGDQYKWV